MTKKRVFSGIQPSGIIHIGNYLGAITQFVEDQNSSDSIFCIVDLHAITVPQDPKELKENTYKLASILLACGIDHKKAPLFVQSHIPEHTELTWILNSITYMGELSRMTQFKEKSNIKNQKPKLNLKSEILNLQSAIPSVGLFDYPVLMASDILLYNTDIVPVGEDQKQHVELCRDLAKRFNSRFGQTFKVPEVQLKKESARIMGFDDPAKKMSKSATSEYNYIALTDNADTITRKIMKAQTDSGKEIMFDQKRAGLYNLLTIYKLFSDRTEEEIEKKFSGKGYGELKKQLAELIVEKLKPIQTKYRKLIADKSHLDSILTSGANKVQPLAKKKLDEVKEKIGLVK